MPYREGVVLFTFYMAYYVANFCGTTNQVQNFNNEAKSGMQSKVGFEVQQAEGSGAKAGIFVHLYQNLIGTFC